MIFKYKNSIINVHGTFELNEDGELIDYEFHVPMEHPLMPIDLSITNKHTVILKSRGINGMKIEEPALLVEQVDTHIVKTRYELVKYLISQDE